MPATQLFSGASFIFAEFTDIPFEVKVVLCLDFYAFRDVFRRNGTNATLKCSQDRSLHRPSLFNCKESPTSHIFHKKGGRIIPTANL